MPSKPRGKVVSVHLPASLYSRFLELEAFLNREERPVWINGCQTTTRAEMIHHIVKMYCLGGWNTPDPDPDSEEEAKSEVLHLKLSQLEALEWRDWIKSGLASTFSELARKALARYLQWSDYLRAEHRQIYQKILQLGKAGDLEGIRRLT